MPASITYTFPADCPVVALAGKTVSGGKPEMFKGAEVVRFLTRVDGKDVMARTAGKPELIAAVATYRAEQQAEQAAKVVAAEVAQPGCTEYAALLAAECNSYTPDAFPGSAAWNRNHTARRALDAFEAAHPELVADRATKRQADQDARYNDLSDLAKNGG